jgi:hypothetical protein
MKGGKDNTRLCLCEACDAFGRTREDVYKQGQGYSSQDSGARRDSDTGARDNDEEAVRNRRRYNSTREWKDELNEKIQTSFLPVIDD